MKKFSQYDYEELSNEPLFSQVISQLKKYESEEKYE